MKGPAYLVGVLVVFDRESLKVSRSIIRMAGSPWLPWAKRRQYLDRDLTLGAIALSQALNSKRVKPRDHKRIARLFVKQARNHARYMGVPLPRLTYWPKADASKRGRRGR